MALAITVPSGTHHTLKTLITDVNGPNLSAVKVLRKLKERHPELARIAHRFSDFGVFRRRDLSEAT